MSGLFITLEGGEGAGKSTQIRRLAARLEALGHRVVVTREPGGSPYAERIREAILAGEGKPYGPFAEALMFSAARLDHLAQTIRPALARGDIVLCDRFSDSTRAYQGALGEIDDGELAALERVVIGETRPDLTLILDLPAETGLARANARRGSPDQKADRFEAENLNFHKRLREAFQALAKADPQRYRVIAADRDAEEVEFAIWQCVKGKFARELNIAMQATEK
ncbi:MAG: dTMP kinase Tmk [Saliniramus fredricksonii]|uniref:Thymidylate kinase n=1 Tax=Saliniramus fredricksonii TaxID=1653334 RepID=A0A0P8BHS7_9HYPH|nr:dTMP kinase [Saliniramus fredricksonii]KPQ08721.1 MAG: dTMP kinase Tmk [Saliniramus fredricksonii]SCC81666.1 dTMP kinase [Saliniramus fredricksonii]